MEEKLKQLYEEYYELLLKCSLNEREKIAYISGAQEAIEFIAKNMDIELEHKNIRALAVEISTVAYSLRGDEMILKLKKEVEI